MLDWVLSQGYAGDEMVGSSVGKLAPFVNVALLSPSDLPLFKLHVLHSTEVLMATYKGAHMTVTKVLYLLQTNPWPYPCYAMYS
jgi:hypothetical protein